MRDMLKYICASPSLPWLCIGDFNEVLHREEHVGVNEHNNKIVVFRHTVENYGLANLGYTCLD